MFVSFSALIARLLIAAYFLFSGFNDLLSPQQEIQRFSGLGLPFPSAMFWASLSLSILCGLLIALGGKTRLAAWALALLTLALMLTTGVHHRTAVGTEMFLRSLPMAGGLILLALYGPGRISLDRG